MNTITGRRSPDPQNDDDYVSLVYHMMVSSQLHMKSIVVFTPVVKVGKKLVMSKGNKGFAGGKYFDLIFASTTIFSPLTKHPSNPDSCLFYSTRMMWLSAMALDNDFVDENNGDDVNANGDGDLAACPWSEGGRCSV